MKDKIPLPLSYQDAKSIVLHFIKDVNSALDYGDAYVFYNSADSNSIGGRGCAIMKSNAKMIPLGEFLYMRNTKASPKQIPF